MSIPYAVLVARGQFRQGRISAREFNAIICANGYQYARVMPAVFGDVDTYSDGRCYCCKPEPLR